MGKEGKGREKVSNNNNNSDAISTEPNGMALAEILTEPGLIYIALRDVWQKLAPLPPEIAGTYLHNTTKGVTICTFNSIWFGPFGPNLSPVAATAPVWAKMMAFHAQVLGQTVLPPKGKTLIYNYWHVKDCLKQPHQQFQTDAGGSKSPSGGWQSSSPFAITIPGI